jgi:hypothetical protein
MRLSVRCGHFSKLLGSLVAIALAAGCAPAAPQAPSAAAQSPPNILPLRSLRLYETGVGYFERSGGVGTRATTLPVPAGHLDDALKSLVVLNGGGGGRVLGVAFSSSVTRATARTRAGLPQEPNAPIAFRDLLASMKGERVLVTRRTAASSESIEGRVIEVTIEEDTARAHALLEHKDAKLDETPKHLVLSLLTDKGELAQVPADAIVTIRPLDPAFAARLHAAVDALSERNAQNARGLELLGDARGAVTFGYIAETPLWRSSYRLVLGDIAELQGWALVHNDTDEDWKGVHLDLVNGEPDSFIFPLAAPRYARRNLVHPEEPLSTLPQLGSTTADALWGEHLDGHGVGTGSGSGYGSGSGRLSGSHKTRAPQIRAGMASVGDSTRASSLLSVGNLADLAPAHGAEQGALFVYSVPFAFSLAARSSALVPFVNKSVEVEQIAFFAQVGGTARAAIRFVNGTGQTLPPGTISVFAGGGFVGETALDRLKPGERRFLEIGNDLDAEVTETKSIAMDESKRLTFESDRLEEHFVRTNELAWQFENRSGAARTFYVVLWSAQNAKITGPDRLDFDEVNKRAIAVFVVPPKTKVVRSFVVTEGLSRSMAIDSLTEKGMKAILQKTAIAPADLAALGASLEKVRALEGERANVVAAQRVVDAANAELERLREDLKALAGGGNAATAAGAAATPLVKRLVDAEDRVSTAEKAKQAAEKALGDRREAVRVVLRKLAPVEP